ncbi:MAG: hypothetical protein DMF61_16100 [Blastocatellia bacterium AA13]|nr:MAG: hypothetical protein DMF61_16100 [Blastocatellia bacterium AA13]
MRQRILLDLLWLSEKRQARMRNGGQRIKRLAIYWAGWGFIILGVIGIFLPILQGILFILIGLLLLSDSSPRAARLLTYLRSRFPNFSKKIDAATDKASRVQARIAAHFQSATRASGKRHT